MSKDHFFSGGVFFDKIFSKIRNRKPTFKIPLDKKLALEKSIRKGKKLQNDRL